MWWCLPVIPTTQEMEVEGLWSENGLGINTKPYLKKSKAKSSRGVVQVVEHLPNKCKTLSLKPWYHQ
jgi:hypothetical protein